MAKHDRDLTFEEGPFFLINRKTWTRKPNETEPWVTPLHEAVIIWATDESVARNISLKILKDIDVTVTYVGNLTDIKKEHPLSSAQITDLHREGYVRL